MNWRIDCFKKINLLQNVFFLFFFFFTTNSDKCGFYLWGFMSIIVTSVAFSSGLFLPCPLLKSVFQILRNIKCLLQISAILVEETVITYV